MKYISYSQTGVSYKQHLIPLVGSIKVCIFADELMKT